MSQKIALHNIEHLDEERVAQRVEDLVFILAVIHQPLRTKNRQMLGNISRFDFDAFENCAYGQFALTQCLDNMDSGRVREGLKDFCFKFSERLEMASVN